MAQMANLLVKDDAATPLEFTFNPITDTPNPFYRTKVAGVPIDGQPRINFTAEKLKNGQWKITAKLEVPVMETLGASGTSSGYVAPPKVAYVTTAIFTMFVDPRSTGQDRANAMKLMIGILQGASSTTATGVLNQASAGGAFVASVLPGPDLFVNAVLPN